MAVMHKQDPNETQTLPHDPLLDKKLRTLETEPSTDEINVGRQLRAIRRQQGLSLRLLAERSGLNFNTLSLIENNKSSPSVSTLQQLSQALGVPITAFFETGQERTKILYQKSHQRPKAAFTHGELEDLGGGMTLGGGQPLLITLKPGADTGPVPITHTGHEFVYCLSGRILYTVDGQSFVLDAGDSMIFEAHLPHRWGNPDSTPSSALLIFCPSDENDRPTERHFMP
jgi:transcriptional regulator with XRE-family HTH domain